MRYLPAALFAAILGLALPALAAPGSINDCEKIEAADAYNRCLALFGPVAHTHGGSAKDFGGDGDTGAGSGGGADVVETANPEASVPQKDRHGAHGRDAHSHWTRHYHHYGHNDHHYGHYGRYSHYRNGRSSAHEALGARKKLAFNVISSHTKKAH